MRKFRVVRSMIRWADKNSDGPCSVRFLDQQLTVWLECRATRGWRYWPCSVAAPYFGKDGRLRREM